MTSGMVLVAGLAAGFGAGLAAGLRLSRGAPPPAPVTVDPVGEGARLRGASSILIRGAALILTMDPRLGEGPLGLIEGGDVWIEGGSIRQVGRGIDAPGAEVVDATGQIVMPGFVDVHDHLWQTIIRGCAPDHGLHPWLKTCVFPIFVAGLGEADAYAAVRLGAHGLVETGVTTVLDFSHAFSQAFVEGNVRALDDAGLRYVFGHSGQERQHDEMRALKAALEGKHPGASLQICAHPGRRMEGWLKANAALARELGVPLNVHLAEDRADLKDEPVETLKEAGAFNMPLLVNHAVHLGPAELDLLAQSDTLVAYNPLSNMRLGAGIMPLGAMVERGIKVGLGLDGGAGDMPDAFANVRAAAGLQRVAQEDGGDHPTVAEILRMATLGGAEVLDLDGEIGSLTPGKSADVIVINPSGPHFAPRTDWPAQLVFNGRPSDVSYVFIGGVVQKAGGEVLGVDVDALVRQVEALGARIQGRRSAAGAVLQAVMPE